MLRFSNIVWMVLIAVTAFGLYLVKYKVQSLHEQVELAESQLREEREAVHVLEAEWTYLNRPDRLRQLANKHLKLTPSDPKQIAEVESIPYKGAKEVVVGQTENKTAKGISPVSLVTRGGQ